MVPFSKLLFSFSLNKDWFLQRRFAMERAMTLKKALDKENFTGLSMSNPSVPDAQKVMWSDLVQGTPDMEDTWVISGTPAYYELVLFKAQLGEPFLGI